MNQTDTLEQIESATIEANETDVEQDVQARLAAINAALAAKQTGNAPVVRVAFTCPTDPAERAACDSCQ